MVAVTLSRHSGRSYKKLSLIGAHIDKYTIYGEMLFQKTQMISRGLTHSMFRLI